MSQKRIRELIEHYGVESFPVRVQPFAEPDYFTGDRLVKPRTKS